MESDVVLKGLRIKKDPCIHDPSEEFSNEWKNVKRTGEKELCELLLEENQRKSIKHQLLFWEKLIVIMERESETEVREKVLWLMDVANTETNILTNRRKNKLNRLIYNFSPCKYDVFTQFSFDILSICEILFEARG